MFAPSALTPIADRGPLVWSNVGVSALAVSKSGQQGGGPRQSSSSKGRHNRIGRMIGSPRSSDSNHTGRTPSTIISNQEGWVSSHLADHSDLINRQWARPAVGYATHGRPINPRDHAKTRGLRRND